MKLIQPNCRIQFTAQDIEFILSVLGPKTGDAECLTRLLADEETRDLILDDEALYRAFLEQPGCLRVSDHLYFYVLIRQVLRNAGIDSRPVADYVAEVLCEFSRTERSRCVCPSAPAGLDYLFEMIGALQGADDRTGFLIRAHIGNHSLFHSGVFPDRIRRRELKGFPNLSYYEELGRASFRMASDHRLAERYSLDGIFTTLADEFQNTRLALNDVSQRLFSFGDPDFAVLLLGGRVNN